MNQATKRKQAQRAKRAALGIKRVEVALSERERQQLDHLRIARAGSGEPYSADEYISTLARRVRRNIQGRGRVLAHPRRQDDSLVMSEIKNCVRSRQNRDRTHLCRVQYCDREGQPMLAGTRLKGSDGK